jgi:hypothetical protein
MDMDHFRATDGVRVALPMRIARLEMKIGLVNILELLVPSPV